MDKPKTELPLSFDIAETIVKELMTMPTRVDVKLETPKCALSLKEYAHVREDILLRSRTDLYLLMNKTYGRIKSTLYRIR
ncbi:phosphoribosyl-dephospho-CoA transferase MdcG domain-containing protein [Paenibacillus terrae]|uniref:phosphoribosyl-dephospho-CoA transferase MdcG domain-containing protein n=1 Tax=Paenibacillus terrae TaxID=159743 RepID=UPI001269F1E7